MCAQHPISTLDRRARVNSSLPDRRHSREIRSVVNNRTSAGSLSFTSKRTGRPVPGEQEQDCGRCTNWMQNASIINPIRKDGCSCKHGNLSGMQHVRLWLCKLASSFIVRTEGKDYYGHGRILERREERGQLRQYSIRSTTRNWKAEDGSKAQSLGQARKMEIGSCQAPRLIDFRWSLMHPIPLSISNPLLRSESFLQFSITLIPNGYRALSFRVFVTRELRCPPFTPS